MVDFILHVLSSALLYVILRALNINTTKALLITILIGILKELFDLIIQNELFDFKDLLFNLTGLLLAWFITNNFIKEWNKI